MAFARRAAALAVASSVLATGAVSAPASAQRDPDAGATPVTSQETQRPVAIAHVRHAALLKRKTVRMYDAPVGAAAGATYRASAKVIALRKQTRARLIVRQVSGKKVLGSHSAIVLTRRHVWRSVGVALPTKSATGRIQVLVKPLGGAKKPIRVRGMRVVRVPASAPSTPTPAPTEWQADLTESFDSLSASRWNVKDNTFVANDSSYLTAANVTTDTGVLRVQGKPESRGGRNYTSGRIDTNGKYALPNYFRAEVRAKVPYQQGMWSAPLWFRPTGGGSGEIDLIEAFGAQRTNPKVYQTIHTAYGADHTWVSTITPFSSLNSVPAADWHVYTIEKTPGHIKMWVDGHLTSDFTAASAPWFAKYYEAGQHWNLRVSMQIGGSFGLPDSTTDWSGDNAAMQLDYIKTWVPS